MTAGADDYLIKPFDSDVHIVGLRHKLEKNPQTPRHLITVRGEVTPLFLDR
jgi:DNA-binding response OmpR family regulator